MSEYSFSKKVKFVPWIGELYSEQDPRVLILGESVNNADKKLSRNIAKELVYGLVHENWSHPFFSKIHDIYSNENHYSKTENGEYVFNREEFWNSVVFYEYVQEVLEGARIRPTQEQWDKSKDPFIEVISKLVPNIVIALGFENYTNLPLLGVEAKPIKVGENIMEIWKYTIQNNNIFVCKTMHPSAPGFSKDKWIKLYEKFLIAYKKGVYK